MATLDELRAQVAAEEKRLADENAERAQLEARLNELRVQRQYDGVALPPTNQMDAVLTGNDADLARWRLMIHRDTFPEQIDVTSREAHRAKMAMISDALRRHARNIQSGRSDLGQGPASFYGGPAPE